MDEPLPVTDPLALESQICFALSVASRGVIAAYRPVLEPLKLTHPQYLVMLALWQHAPLSLKDLAGRLHMEPATLSPLTKRLEALGYVQRAKNPDDGRGLALSLTEQGRTLRQRAEQVPVEMMQRLQMDEGELKDLHRLMTTLMQRVHP
ncbi:MarR family transcriptional regulator [Citricoccus zhacaiensis]|uniref:MarR family transcriptional regulator n=1 Tax=Citricoccus zhacaiensis TaxID=489142 RepID=A0ABQ2LVF3_9MICC|nr:MarR family transcriptional regulator [Citricoccus zhacaiensis]GGO42693.1 MarR family transcriptional regulator [Citricoccus zhacaiensis]